MSDRRPWWYSGDDDESSDGASPHEQDPADAQVPSTDWTALLSGAVRMVDWATTAVMAPHAEHGDPADHPQCVVCRTLVLVRDPVPPPVDRPAPAEPITWIPFRQ